MAKKKKVKTVAMPHPEMHKKMSKLMGSAKTLFVVTDPEDADRVLEGLDGKKYEFKHGALEKVVVSKAEAEVLLKKFPYLVAEKA